MKEKPSYPYPEIPERDVQFLQQLSIGFYPEEIPCGSYKKLRKLRSMGVDYPVESEQNCLAPVERKMIYLTQETEEQLTRRELAQHMGITYANVRVREHYLRRKGVYLDVATYKHK